jgi:NADH:ubiquinone oxidoreductase subunit 6 (subunit J)
MPASFYIIALFTVVSAFCAMALPNLVHCALCLALSFMGVAGLFMHMNAGFVAFAQILVYVGAVAILIVFAILLTRNAETAEQRAGPNLLLTLPLTVIVGAILLNATFSTKLVMADKVATAPPVRELGRALMTTHVVPLEIIGVLLTVALLGAVVLALPERATQNQGGEL